MPHSPSPSPPCLPHLSDYEKDVAVARSVAGALASPFFQVPGGLVLEVWGQSDFFLGGGRWWLN